MEEFAGKKEEIKILVVDDVDTNRFVLRDIIREMGYDPVLAENGMQALRIVERIRPQLMILDIAMPGMDGIETFEYMRMLLVDTPVIFLTASGDENDVRSAIKLGAVDYLKKPFLPSELLRRVAKELEVE